MQIVYYTNIKEFLNDMQYLQDEYNKIDNYYKFLHHKTDIQVTIEYLNKLNILCYTGFRSQKLIKITVSDEKKNKICLNYKFKNYTNYYDKIIQFLRKKECDD